MYYRARYYIPNCGRFASEDPIGIIGGINLYVYGNGNPITFADALGLAPSCSSIYAIPLAPPSVSVFDNMDQARGVGAAQWYRNVRNHGAWDYKQQGPQYQDFGNFNYGATAWALGLPDWVADRGAGWAQERAGTRDRNTPWYNRWWGLPPYGDDPVDQANIHLGQVVARDYFAGSCGR